MSLAGHHPAATHLCPPPLRQTVGHVIVTDCAKNSGNKAVFAPNQTPPLLWWPTMDEGRRITQRPPPIGQRPPPTDTAAIQGSSKEENGKRSCSCQLSRLLTCTGNLLKLKTTSAASQFASLSVCHCVSQSIHQYASHSVLSLQMSA